MTASDNDFIEFLEEEGDFKALLDSFKITLLFLFASLLYSISLYVGSEYIEKNVSEGWLQHKILFIIFQFLFVYSLIATGLSVKDTIIFSQYRARFLINRKRKGN
jgi:hypothetical protein